MEVLSGEEIAEKLSEVFSKAENSVKIASAWVRGKTLKELLRNLGEGVNVELIIRASSLSDLRITDSEVFEIVNSKRGKIYLNQNLHSKFVVVDGEQAILGSANITHTALSPEGNVETALYFHNKAGVKKLEELFESLKANSKELSNVVGFVLNSESASKGEILLLEDLVEQAYVRAPLEEGNFLLLRVFGIRVLNTAFGGLLDNKTLTDTLFKEQKEWAKASLLALANEGAQLRLAKFEVLGKYESDRGLFKTPLSPLQAGCVVEALGDEDESLSRVMLKNLSGYDMGLPTYVGRLQGTRIKAFLDMEKVLSTHLAVLGATGSGKTTLRCYPP